MKRIIPMALLALTLAGGSALAEPERARFRDHRNGSTVVTPSRGHVRAYDDNRSYDHGRRYDRSVHVQRTRPVFRDNRFYFAGGHQQTYQRPVIQYRYRNYYQRPALIVENMQPVAGYVWTAGQWEWNGHEWHWVAGHYEVDTSYQGYNNNTYEQPYYNNSYDSTYDSTYEEPVYNNYQAPTYYNNYQAPTVQGGVSVQGSWNF